MVSPLGVMVAFVALAELALGGLAALAAGLSLRRSPSTVADDSGRQPLLQVTAGRLFLVVAASLPLLYLLLKSYLEVQPSVVCVQGIIRLGSASDGVASWLPLLLRTVVVTKAAALLALGAWISLNAVERRGGSAWPARRLTVWITAAGVLAAIDASAGLAYLAIPKRETRLAAGCCTTAALVSREMPAIDPDGSATRLRRWGWTAAFLGTVAAMAAGVGLTLGRDLRDAGQRWWGPWAVAGAVATAFCGGGFLSAALAPARLRLPLHECAFCLLDAAPELWAGVAALLGATSCVVWASVVAATASAGGFPAAARSVVRPLLIFAGFGYSLSGAMAVAERWLV